MIKLIDICKKYDEHIIFDHFNLEFPKDKITCILGESGVGKTTLLNMISGLTSYKGKIESGDKISYIFQEARLIPSLTVKENLKFTSPEASDERIEELLTRLEILDKKDTYPTKLSGGEAQRVSIARAFLYDADIILMDEPFSSLDLSLKYKLISYFGDLWNLTKKTVIFVTHDIDEALLLSDDILLLRDGRIEKKYHTDSDLPRKLEEQENLRKEIIKEIICKI
ncbi:MAG: ATP-binding cassette domain-containing protein [Anaeroplasmataceae bacterium]|nr:ATP-binding cassette domain-containing protein [Anaeroplasmataceae bacterium]MDE6414293.1 ATP-binding cassette domain-containing protein [Anaeroplasmataceae bacterium]